MMEDEKYVVCGRELAELKPTAELQWVLKYIPAPHLGENVSQAERILQQKWVASARMPDGCTWEEHRWRDVPTAPRTP